MPQGYLESHLRLRWWQGSHAFRTRLRFCLKTVVDMIVEVGELAIEFKVASEIKNPPSERLSYY